MMSEIYGDKYLKDDRVVGFYTYIENDEEFGLYIDCESKEVVEKNKIENGESQSMEKFKYQIGQVVKVRNDIGHAVFCSMENNEKGAYVVENMKAYGGKKVTISHYEGGRYKIKEDGGVYIWTDEMFEEKKEKSKNEVTHFDDFVARMQIKIERVIYNGTTTILFYKVPLVNNYGQTLSYSNEKKVVAKCRPEDEFSKEIGLEVCTIKAFRKELEKMLKKF